VTDFSFVDRTNLIKDILTKLQGSKKKQEEMEEDDCNPKQFEMGSGAKNIMLTSEKKAKKKKDKNKLLNAVLYLK
jgi:hypothetical protein